MFGLKEYIDVKKYIKWTIWIIVIVYGLFIYPNPERFPTLASRLVSFIVLLIGLSTLFIKEDNVN